MDFPNATTPPSFEELPSPAGTIAHWFDKMAEINLQEIHDFLIEIAYEAGRMQLAARPSNQSVDTKKSSTDLVTETDRAVEAMVTTRLKEAYPTFQFIGEETYVPGQKLTASPTFICDPIDGTTNFVHAFPAFCISLGLAVEKRSVVGVIYNPTLDELYTAIQGQGAYLRRKDGERQRLPLREPEALTGLDTCLVGIEWGSARSGNNFEVKSRTFERLCADKALGGAMVHSVRAMGSAALNIAAVAAGSLDLWWEGGPWAWDVCAGWVILTEAGGIMVGGNPGDWEIELDDRSYTAVRGAPSGQREIVQELWDCMDGRRMAFES